MVSAAQARTRQAEAAIENTQAKAAAMQAAVEQAQARETRAGADRDTAQAQVQAAQAAYQAGLAVVSEKAAGERASASQVAQAAAAVGQSAAALTAATTVRGYTEIRATQPGKVIQRPVSPGVLAAPGMMLLRIAQVNRVRLQAYVTEQDLQWLRVGDPVEARHPPLPGGLLRARVTSIFPAADPATRTAIVEALVDNPGETLAPGDALSLTITTPPRPGVLTVPNSALVYLPVPGAAAGALQQAAVWVAGSTGRTKTVWVCPMGLPDVSDKPGKANCGMDRIPKQVPDTSAGAPGSPPGGAQTAHQIQVTLGASDGERTEIVAGVTAGQEVIYRGQTGLREGDRVSVVPWSAQGPTELPPAPAAAPAPGAPPSAAPAAPSMPGMKMGSTASLPPLLQGEGAGGGALRLLVARLLQRGWW
jgi:multidrug efflux pump subunit AcrA (membrane-fusion protein)